MFKKMNVDFDGIDTDSDTGFVKLRNNNVQGDIEPAKPLTSDINVPIERKEEMLDNSVEKLLVDEELKSRLELKTEENEKLERKAKRKIRCRNVTITGLIIIIILLLLRSCSADVEFLEIEKTSYSIPADYDSFVAEDGRVSILGWADGE